MGNPWIVHSEELDRAWSERTNRQLAAIAGWAPNNLGRAYESSGTMFYMFSGPDFLYAHAFFPDAHTYILAGNEPVGPLPDPAKIPPNDLAPALANIRKSLESVLNWSFFITKNMKVDLTQPQLSGTVPLLYLFLARAGCTIESVTPVTVDSAGNVIDGIGEKESGRNTPGVRISFRSHSAATAQILYYFCTDLSDDGIKSTPGLIRFCEKQGRGVSLLKAASYLMHEPGFSRVREFLLDHSDTIVQDDSGIPFRFFVENGDAWNLQLSGPYAGPIDIFKQYYQPDLANAFATTPGSPLPFGFGYNWAATKSNLMVATKKG